MLPPDYLGITLGPLFRTIAHGAKWRDDPVEQFFPSSQVVADEYERYLAFIASQGQFDRFLPRLRADARQRDAAVREIAPAFMFHRDGFPVVEWEPTGRDGKIGEFVMEANGARVFVEVKGPDWYGELQPAEREARKLRAKDVNGEARSICNIYAIRHSVEQARAKFAGTEPSVLVLADDFFLPLQFQTWACDVALFSARQPGWTEGYLASDGPFATTEFSNVGGVMVFWFDRDSSREFCEAAFGTRLYVNPNADPVSRLPQSLIRAYSGIDQPAYR